MDTLKEKRTALYDAEKKESPVRITFYMAAQKLLEEKPENEDFTYKDEEYIWQMLREGAYIVIEPEICKLLDWHGSKGGYVDIKEGSRYIRRIACAAVSGEDEEIKASEKEIGIMEFIRDSMLKVIHKEKHFPLVLCTRKVMKEDAKCRLWVKKVFGKPVLFSLDDNDIVNRLPKESDELRYLILPVTNKTWANIEREAHMSDGITKGMYDDIVKKEDEWKLLVEWTYCYQDSEGGEEDSYRQNVMGRKQKRGEIWKQYMTLLDLLYEECFINIG